LGQGALKPLIAVCDESADLAVLGNASGALRNIARHPTLRFHLIEADCTQQLLTLTIYEGDEGSEITSKDLLRDIQGNSSAALANLALDPLAAARIVQGGVISTLLSVIDVYGSGRVLPYGNTSGRLNLPFHICSLSF
jgi:hypothetical protein